jgi:HSP20 family protein
MEKLMNGSPGTEAVDLQMWGLLSPCSSSSTQSATNGIWHPLADIKVTPKYLTVFLDLPGVDEDSVDVAADGGTLRICGERDFDHDAEDAEEFSEINRIYGEYLFETPLPSDAVAGEVTAKYKRGVLKVRVPRRERRP